MYAVIVTGGKQYRVIQGETLKVEKIDLEEGKSFDIDSVLMIGNGALFYRPVVDLLGNRYLLFDVGGVIGIAAMSATLVTAAVRHTRALYRAETV